MQDCYNYEYLVCVCVCVCIHASTRILCLALKAYYILDELLVGGEIQETSKKNIIRAISAQDMLQEVYVTFVLLCVCVCVCMCVCVAARALDSYKPLVAVIRTVGV